ncbi:RpiB/LacA/LacB family sugar-phosphate isomerase [Pelosinus fermentans]|uniref:Sugar-phosphate isomerase, RpiB/LacA/LacB family n=1 Tax=Pelosinus fermentans JBW45 TaxID=1192197 RepID=I8TND5_9FIRM|nr:RpiB/LacA/LacB family sugar-phosphate isomerase [Pelosinus fermentans]AJQ26332.1 sugar-phosphate isomerase, RpiB/LacA/LacB family [Pelosinus fermentans JBW45]
MKIAIGCDNAAFELKNILKKYMEELGHEVRDFGIPSADDSTFYPNIAETVAESVKKGESARGMLLCGTGIGMCITANKIPGIFAALCHDTFSAERAIKSNNAQIITMGARVIGSELAKVIAKTWLASEFTPGSSTPKINLVADIDKKYRG